MTARVPASVALSLGLHAAFLALFLALTREAPRQAQRVVEGVDLLIQSPKPRPAQDQPAPKPPPLSTMDFLKMALPNAPRASAPAALQIKAPEAHKIALADAPKLQDRARKDMAPKLDSLDLSRERVSVAKMEAKFESRRQAAATLAALPRLEEVGQRRVKNLPEALALEDRRREAVAAQGLPDLAVKPATRRQALAAVTTLQEAAPSERVPERKGLAALLPTSPLEIKPRPQAVMAPRLAETAEPRASRRQAQVAVEGQKKGVEIEGPLADRQVAAYDVPPFPEWARNQGVLEASVSIRFTVDQDGNVMPGMRVVNSSGYGRLDKLAMESLKNWRFAPKPGEGAQWGVITFRFVLG